MARPNLRFRGDESFGDDHYGYSRKEVARGLKWLKGFDRHDKTEMLFELYKEHLFWSNTLRLVMDPVTEKYYNTPDVSMAEYKQSRGVMSPACFVELRPGWWDNFGPDELEWEFVDDPYDAEYCILKSDYDRGRSEEWMHINDLDDSWDGDDVEYARVRREYLFFNEGDDVNEDFDWDWFVSGGMEENDLDDGIEEWIEEFEDVLARMD